MQKFKRGQLVKSSKNHEVFYKVTTLHKNGDFTIVSHSPSWLAGHTYRMMHGDERFSVVPG